MRRHGKIYSALRDEQKQHETKAQKINEKQKKKNMRLTFQTSKYSTVSYHAQKVIPYRGNSMCNETGRHCEKKRVGWGEGAEH